MTKRRVQFQDRYETKENRQQEGVFHEFGTNFLEFETGPGNYSTAIIEMDNGVVKNIPVEDVIFLD